MKLVAFILSALISSAAAAPAIVWSGAKAESKHSSDVIDAHALMTNVVTGSDSSLKNIVFVVGRDANGSEGLTGLTSSGSLPKVASKYADASSVHHYVRGIESIATITKDAKASTQNVHVTSLSEFKAAVESDSSNLVVVNVSADASPSEIDAAVTSAIEDSKVGSVVLTAVRGISEVKLERNANAKRNMYQMHGKTNGRRRLADNEDADEDTSGIYFVHFTPNIFAGLLFGFFFMFITYVGLGCMDMISGQDVYVTKYPTIGREV